MYEAGVASPGKKAAAEEGPLPVESQPIFDGAGSRDVPLAALAPLGETHERIVDRW